MAVKSFLFATFYLFISPFQVQAFFRINCNIIQTGRVDPVINPGGVSSHVHTVAGASGKFFVSAILSSQDLALGLTWDEQKSLEQLIISFIAFGVSSNYDSLSASSCTSCEVQKDKSAYWTPLLYYQHKDGSFEPVTHGGMVVYYLGRGDNTANFSPFPKGLQMLSGDNGVRSYDSGTLTAAKGGRPVADRVSFACLDKSGPFPEKPYMWRTQCSNGLRAQIHFQSCWDGVNLYKSDQSHVAYLSQIDNGVCPSTHPVLLPHLFYEVLYGVANIKQDGGQFVFSNGDTTGYGFHGDFQNGWDPTILSAAANPQSGCLFTTDQRNGTFQGDVNSCPILHASDSSYSGWNCPERPAIVNEPVSGPLRQLPGCNPISSGPGRAPAPPANCPIPSLNNVPPEGGPAPTTPSQGTQRVGAWTYAGCAQENSGGRALSQASTSNANTMTIESCTSFCAGKNLPLAGLEYGRECYCGSALKAPAKILDGKACDAMQYMNCAGNKTEICGAPSLLTVWKNGAGGMGVMATNETEAGG
ncbi:MAG: hypothetical protein Q9160_001271 [Pyrenula sp. 1 TL-2023]